MKIKRIACTSKVVEQELDGGVSVILVGLQVRIPVRLGDSLFFTIH